MAAFYDVSDGLQSMSTAPDARLHAVQLAHFEYSDGTQAVDALVQAMIDVNPADRHVHTASQLVWASEYAARHAPWMYLHWVLQPEADRIVPLPHGLIRGQWKSPDGSTLTDHAKFVKFGREGEKTEASFYTPIQTKPFLEGEPSTSTFHLERLQDVHFGEGGGKKKFEGILTCTDR